MIAVHNLLTERGKLEAAGETIIDHRSHNVSLIAALNSMPQIHKFIAKDHVIHYFVSQWNADMSLAEMYSSFKVESVAAGVDPDSERFLGFIMQAEHMYYAGCGELGLMSTHDEFELLV